MFTVEKTFRIPMGHRLSKHKGLCKNFHGHNFVIKVKVGSKELDENDMVIDFSDLKKLVNEILDAFDHSTILNINDPAKEQFFDLGYRIWLLDSDPTAEAFCKHLFHEISDALKNLAKRDVYLVSVKIWENEDSVAEYMPITLADLG